MNVKAFGQADGFYGLATYLVIIISFNLPFLMEEYGLSSGRAGILISLFFYIMAPGFVLNKIVQVLGTSYLYGLFVDDSLWNGDYSA